MMMDAIPLLLLFLGSSGLFFWTPLLPFSWRGKGCCEFNQESKPRLSTSKRPMTKVDKPNQRNKEAFMSRLTATKQILLFIHKRALLGCHDMLFAKSGATINRWILFFFVMLFHCGCSFVVHFCLSFWRVFSNCGNAGVNNVAHH